MDALFDDTSGKSPAGAGHVKQKIACMSFEVLMQAFSFYIVTLLNAL